jgi:hypothetical protein
MTNEAQEMLDNLTARTSFIALPKIVSAGQKRVDEIVRNAAGRNAVNGKVLVGLLNTCIDEAIRAEINFDGLHLLSKQNVDTQSINVELAFTVTRRLQIYDIFSVTSIYRIPYEVFHPENFKIVIRATITELRVIYNEVYPRKKDGTQLQWIHVFTFGGRLCLGTLGNTFRNEGLDGTFMAKLLSSFECVNLNSPARSASGVSVLEPEYHRLAGDIYNASTGVSTYRTWRDVAVETPVVEAPAVDVPF